MEEDKAVAIKKNGLAGLAIFGDEEKEGTGEEINIHLLDDNIGEGVVALPHVGVPGIEENGVLGIKNHVRLMPRESSRVIRKQSRAKLRTSSLPRGQWEAQCRYRWP